MELYVIDAPLFYLYAYFHIHISKVLKMYQLYDHAITFLVFPKILNKIIYL